MQRFKMAKPRIWNLFGMILMMSFQIGLQEKDWTQHGLQKETILSINQNVIEENKEHKNQDMTDSETSESTISTNKGELEYESTKCINEFVNRNPRSTSLDLLTSQFEELCVNIGSQPCTCNYPDNPDVTKFELSTDSITMIASDANGTGPANCKDLQALGHSLNGFYIVPFRPKKQTKAIYCEFQQGMKVNYIDTSAAGSTLKKEDHQGSRDDIRFKCGDEQISATGCTFLYPDHPDTPEFEIIESKGNFKKASNLNSGEPTSCEYLSETGYTLKGFYVVRLNSIKTKIVYCDFSRGATKVNTKTAPFKTKSKLCSTIGSPPCSCNYPYFPNSTFQLELSNDELTRSASGKNGMGPASCNDLELIGYNLDGFYIVRSIEQVMKIVFCEFGSNDEVPIPTPPRIPTTMKKILNPSEEKKILLQTTPETDKIEQPVHSTQSSLKINENMFQSTVVSNSETPKSDKNLTPVDQESIQQDLNKKTSAKADQSATTQVNEVTTAQPKMTVINIITGAVSPTPVKFSQGKPLNPPSGYVLMNDNGKCLAVETTGTINPAENGAKIIQATCDPSENGQLWKYDQRTQRLCNEWKKCLSVPFNVRLDIVIPFDLVQWEPVDGQITHQKWSQFNDQFLSGGMCLAFQGDMNPPRAKLGYCYNRKGSKEMGTMWKLVGN